MVVFSRADLERKKSQDISKQSRKSISSYKSTSSYKSKKSNFSYHTEKNTKQVDENKSTDYSFSFYLLLFGLMLVVLVSIYFSYFENWNEIEKDDQSDAQLKYIIEMLQKEDR